MERYNFVTDNIDDLEKVSELVSLLQDICTVVFIQSYKIISVKLVEGVLVKTYTTRYFISGQSLEVDSNCGCIELRNILNDEGVAAVFINGPTETGVIKIKPDVETSGLV